MSDLCGAPTVVDGAHGCPRRKGHRGAHYWWLEWEDGAGLWRVMVYSGEPKERRRRVRGRFTTKPTARDVHRLILTVAPLRRRDLARRTPASEPEPSWRAVPDEEVHRAVA